MAGNGGVTPRVRRPRLPLPKRVRKEAWIRKTLGDAGLEAVRKVWKIAFGMQMKRMASEINIG